MNWEPPFFSSPSADKSFTVSVAQPVAQILGRAEKSVS